MVTNRTDRQTGRAAVPAELRRVRAFATLSSTELEAAAAQADRHGYQRGTILDCDGRSRVYAIAHGQVHVSLLSIHGRQLLLNRWTSGDLFELLRSDRDDASDDLAEVTADGTVLYAFPLASFLDVVTGDPGAAEELILALWDTLRRERRLLAVLGLHGMSERLAHVLAGLGRAAPDQVVTVSREELAAMIGTRREEVIRILRAFRERGLIAYEPYDRQIRIVDTNGLQDYRARSA